MNKNPKTTELSWTLKTILLLALVRTCQRFMQNSSDVGTIHLQLLAHTVKNDHIIEMFLSKLSLYDKVRVIYYTYFLSKGFKQDDIFFQHR